MLAKVQQLLHADAHGWLGRGRRMSRARNGKEWIWEEGDSVHAGAGQQGGRRDGLHKAAGMGINWQLAGEQDSKMVMRQQQSVGKGPETGGEAESGSGLRHGRGADYRLADFLVAAWASAGVTVAFK